ncbi:MAG: riboflavin synthase [Candidatus Andersenbacteria bacterium]|nr:riboflavin synthase [Candidatus Andersenbacteria bacterium]
MFAGIVEGTGRVAAAADRLGGVYLTVRLGKLGRVVRAGDSLAVDGVCLTAVSPRGGTVHFVAVPETLRKTTLGQLEAGSMVNIEHSLKVGSRLAGHFVQGHVEGVGTVVSRRERGADVRLRIRPPPALMPYLAPLSSVAVHGVSLTVARAGRRDFTVALIPTTLRLTNLGQLKVGDKVNLETDLVARHIIHWLKMRRG